MTEDAELQARIAAVAGKINQRKQHHQPVVQQPQYPYSDQYSPQSYRGYGRWTPYGRGGRAGFQPTHKNKTLVLGGNGTSASAKHIPDPVVAGPQTHSDGFGSIRGTSQQLMNKPTYEREQKQKEGAKEQERAAKKQKRNTEEQHRILRHFDTASGQASREMVIEGIRFELTDNGSKLIRVPGKQTHIGSGTPKLSATDASNAGSETPKRTSVVGVGFFRTKHGNLVRASALTGAARYLSETLRYNNDKGSLFTCHRPVKQSPQCEHFTKHGTILPFQHTTGYARARTPRSHHIAQLAGKCIADPLTLCAGICPYGSRCRFAHDPNKVAMCKDFIKTDSCPRGDNCDMSHEVTYHRVPACTFFLRGNCTNVACRYPHVHVSPAASVCRPFATLGYCAKGPDCDKRHVVECPDYANHGFCANRENGKCSLPHPDRASNLRKAAERQAKMASENESDLSSDDEDQGNASMEDVDSDAEDVFMMDSGDDSHELTQQQDYVAFA